jgi:hypothetical protein
MLPVNAPKKESVLIAIKEVISLGKTVMLINKIIKKKVKIATFKKKKVRVASFKILDNWYALTVKE